MRSLAVMLVALSWSLIVLAATHRVPGNELALNFPDDWKIAVEDEVLFASAPKDALRMRIKAHKIRTGPPPPDLPRPPGLVKIGKFEREVGEPEQVALDGFIVIRFRGHLEVDDKRVEAERWTAVRRPNPRGPPRGPVNAIDVLSWAPGGTLADDQRAAIRKIVLTVHTAR